MAQQTQQHVRVNEVWHTQQHARANEERYTRAHIKLYGGGATHSVQGE